jgi:hypothetical protein
MNGLGLLCEFPGTAVYRLRSMWSVARIHMPPTGS